MGSPDSVAFWMFEVIGVDATRPPSLLVIVGLGGGRAAAEIFLRVRLLSFNPLIHLGIALQLQRVRGNAKLVVGKRLGGSCQTAHLDELAGVGGVHRVRADRNDCLQTFPECFDAADGPAFIPPE